MKGRKRTVKLLTLIWIQLKCTLHAGIPLIFYSPYTHKSNNAYYVYNIPIEYFKRKQIMLLKILKLLGIQLCCMYVRCIHKRDVLILDYYFDLSLFCQWNDYKLMVSIWIGLWMEMKNRSRFLIKDSWNISTEPLMFSRHNTRVLIKVTVQTFRLQFL